jgi:lipopolysaccharide/colanic/teichoic acid biosynthesis glycosyltransferase
LFFPIVAIVTSVGYWFSYYLQTMTGYGAKPYTIIKLRTMRKDAESDGLARPAAKMTSHHSGGNILAKSRIDELPQFL